MESENRTLNPRKFPIDSSKRNPQSYSRAEFSDTASFKETGHIDPMEIKIVREAISKAELNELAKQQFGDMVKA